MNLSNYLYEYNVFHPGSLPDYLCAVDCSAPSYMSKASILLSLLVGAFIVRKWWAVPIGAAISTFAFVFLDNLTRSFTYTSDLYDEDPSHFVHLSLPEFFWDQLSDLFSSHTWILAGVDTLLFNLAITAVSFGFIQAATRLRQKGYAVRLMGFVTIGIFAAPMFAFLIYKSSPELFPRSVLESVTEALNQAPKRCTTQSAKIVEGIGAFASTKPDPKVQSNSSIAENKVIPARTVQSTWTTFEHALTRPKSIRVPDPNRYGPLRAIALDVVIDEGGNVVSAHPKAGPSELFDQAVQIASAWKFIPFTVDGRATPVMYVRAKVDIDGLEKWESSKQSTPVLAERSSFFLRYRGWTHEDKVLSVWVRGDGSVTITDGYGSALQGAHCALIPAATIDRLIAHVRSASVFSMKGRYRSRYGSHFLTVGFGDEIKTISAFKEDGDDVPNKFWNVIDALHEELNTQRWTHGNRFTVPTLRAEKWNFARTDDDNRWLTSRVAAFGDEIALRDLVDVGAHFETSSDQPSVYNKVPSVEDLLSDSTKTTAIEGAAEHGSLSKLKMLFDTKIKWSGKALEGAYVAALAIGDEDLIQLVKSKGPSSHSQDRNRKTALMAAAESGIPAEVDRLLRDGANAAPKGQNQLTALHWAAGFEFQRSIGSLRVDRPKVIDLLVKAGASIDARDTSATTPLLANWMGLPDVTAALIRHGADVNAQDEDGNTPLMTNKSLQSVRLLLKSGADPYKKNEREQNALEVARADIFAQDIAVEIESWMKSHPKR